MREVSFLILAFWATTALGQSLEPTLLGTAGGSSSTLDWSVGETVIATIGNSENTLTQGFHQTLLTIIGVEETTETSDISIYPNPTRATFTINFNQGFHSNIRWVILDLSGKEVMRGSQQTPAASYNVSDLAAGVYMIQIEFDQSIRKTYRLVKQG